MSTATFERASLDDEDQITRDRGVHRHVRARSRPRLPEQLRHLACASVPARRGPGPGEAIRRSARAPGRKAARARRNRADGARPVTSSLGPPRRRARSREDGARPRRPRPARRRRHPLRDDRRAAERGCGMGRRARGPREDPRRRAAQGAGRVALARAPGGALRRSALPKPSGSPRRAPSAHRGRDDQGRRGGHALGGRAPERGSAARHERVRDRPRAAARRCRDDRRRTACPGARHARRDDRGRNARGVVRARTALHAGSRRAGKPAPGRERDGRRGCRAGQDGVRQGGRAGHALVELRAAARAPRPVVAAAARRRARVLLGTRARAARRGRVHRRAHRDDQGRASPTRPGHSASSSSSARPGPGRPRSRRRSPSSSSGRRTASSGST